MSDDKTRNQRRKGREIVEMARNEYQKGKVRELNAERGERETKASRNAKGGRETKAKRSKKGRKTNAEKSNRDTKTVEDVKQKTKGLEPNTENRGPETKAEEN